MTLRNEATSITVTTRSSTATARSSPQTPPATWTALPSCVPRSPSHPCRENIWVSYLAEKLFPGRIHAPQLGSWIFEMIKLDCTSLAYLTACCVGAAFYGRTHGMLPDDIKAASSYYAQALQALNANLNDSALWRSPTNVPAAMLLGIYELMVFRHNGGFVKHAGGASALIKSRGPDAHKSFPSRTYFAMARTAITADAIVRRKRCFLEEPEWQSITTTVPPGPIKNGFEIADIMCRVPGLLEDHEAARRTLAATGSAPEVVDTFHHRIHAMLLELFAWRFKWQRLYEGLAYEVPALETSCRLTVDESGSPLFDTVIFYRSFHPARQLGFYLTCIILILEVAQAWGITHAPAEALAALAGYDSHSASVAAGPLALPHVATSREEAAREILRSVEFYLQGEHRLAGAMHLLTPLRLASLVVTDERQLAWLKRITDRMAECHGFQFSTRLQNAERFSKDWSVDS
ncbi:MAG: hypothetical protein INR71_15210 [Terriglobus roseus]|nr:hypothetical protein [Terriglobus roseus]